jgi:hypothetical protein
LPSSPVEQRNFYLTLSILEGQRLAHSAGFSVPSVEVQESELLDIIQKWLILSSIGALDGVKECSDWMMDMLEESNEWEDEDIDNTKNIISSFGVGLISHLIDNEVLLINKDSVSDQVKTNFTDFMGLFVTMDEDYDDEEDEEEDDE